MKNQEKALNENSVRVIKISKTALFEFIYKKFIENQDAFFDVDSLDVTSTFDINFERGEFIFCTYKSEDGKGKIVEFPKEIDLQRLMAVLPYTYHQCLLMVGIRNIQKKNLCRCQGYLDTYVNKLSFIETQTI